MPAYEEVYNKHPPNDKQISTWKENAVEEMYQSTQLQDIRDKCEAGTQSNSTNPEHFPATWKTVRSFRIRVLDHGSWYSCRD